MEQGLKEGIVVAVGECGLDYDRLFFCPKGCKVGFEAQLAWLGSQPAPVLAQPQHEWRLCSRLCAAARAGLVAASCTLGGVATSLTAARARFWHRVEWVLPKTRRTSMSRREFRCMLCTSRRMHRGVASNARTLAIRTCVRFCRPGG